MAFGMAGSALLCLIAALVYAQLFDAGTATAVLSLAAVLPGCAVLAVTRGRTCRAAAAVGVSLIALVFYGVEAGAAAQVSHWAPGGAAWNTFAGGLLSGWKQLLSVGLPANASGGLEMAPLVVVWVAATAAALISLRRSAGLGLVGPPGLAFTGGLLFGSARPSPSDLFYAGAFVLVAALMLTCRAIVAQHDQRSSARALDRDARWRSPDSFTPSASRGADVIARTSLALPAAGLITVAAFGMTNLLPVAQGDHRFDPRRYLHQPLRLNDQISPLVELDASLQQKPAKQLYKLVIQVSHGATMPDRLRVADLDVFNGASWSSDARFQIGGSRVASASRTQARIAETVTALGNGAYQLGPYLPVAGSPMTVNAGRFAYDPAGGQLIGPNAGKAGYTYQVTAAPTPSEATLSPSAAEISQQPDAFLIATPQISGQLQSIAETITTGQTTPVRALDAIQAYLRSNERYSPSSAPGESIAAITRVLSQTHAGNSGQLAEAFAVLARYTGIPTRIAVGYRLDSANSPEPGQYLVTTADAFAWPEVEFPKSGWVAFNPTDLNQVTQSSPTPEKADQKKPLDQSGPSLLPTQPQQMSAAGAGKGGGSGSSARRTASTVSLWALILIALVLLPPGIVVMVKGERKRRRTRAGPPGERVLGAWRESRDRLHELGSAIAWALTPLEAANMVYEVYSPTPPVAMRDLALLVTDFLYSQFPVEETDARQAWDLEGALEEELKARTSRWMWWRARFDPRPLFPSASRRRQPIKSEAIKAWS
jgi:transglutaminase-like putative cysteine protease